ncbi:MAG: hypothetical protein JWN52_7290 [Actinomycetia bacterium]|nr:hypothetical protein [Actinomycetes bacterium]
MPPAGNWSATSSIASTTSDNPPNDNKDHDLPLDRLERSPAATAPGPYGPEQLRTLAIGDDAPAGDGRRIVVLLRVSAGHEKFTYWYTAGDEKSISGRLTLL